MKPKQIVTLIGILVVCVLVAAILRSKKSATYTEPAKNVGERLFPDFPVNDITSASVIDEGEAVTIEKKEGSWTVTDRDGYPADFEKVSEFLQEVWGIEIVEAQKVSKAGITRLKLDPPVADAAKPEDEDSTGTQLLFGKSEAGDAAKFVIGESVMSGTTVGSGTSNAGGIFLKPEASGSDVYKVATSFAGFQPRPADWLDKSWVKTSKILRLKVTAPDEADSFELIREDSTGKFEFANPRENEMLDEAKTGPLKNSFANTAFKDILVGDEAQPSIVEGGPVFEIETADGFNYTIKIGAKIEEDNVYPVSIEVSAEIDTEYAAEPEVEDTPVEEASEEMSDEDKAAKEKEIAEKKAAKEAAAVAKKEAFEANVKSLQEKLAKEKEYQGHIYLVSSWSLDSLLKKRSDLLKEEEELLEADEDNSGAPRKPISAVTHPIEIPMPTPAPETSQE